MQLTVRFFATSTLSAQVTVEVGLPGSLHLTLFLSLLLMKDVKSLHISACFQAGLYKAAFVVILTEFSYSSLLYDVLNIVPTIVV